MKIKYFIIAGSQSYEFLHGMYHTAIVEFDANTNLEIIKKECNEE